MSKHRFRFQQPTKADLKLIDAAHNGQLDRCIEAFDEGARVDAVSHQYATPLGEACWSDCIEIVRLLLRRGADPNLLKDDKTPLMEAAYRGNREIIDLLLNIDADIHAKLEVANGVFMDVPQFALEGGHRNLAIHLRSLINQVKNKSKG